MAGKKIGLTLALDGEKEFAQQVQNARKETKLFETQLKDLDKSCEGNANALETLEKRHELLEKTQKSASRAVEEANKGLKKAEDNYREIGKEVDDYEKKLEEARQALDKLEKSGDTSSKTYEKQQKEVQKLEKDVEKLKIAHTKEAGSITDWNKKVYETESALKKADKELARNSKYIEEARKSSDKCATSIDEFGKEVKEAASNLSGASQEITSFADTIEEAGDKTAVFEGVLQGNLASTAITKGMEFVAKGAEAVKESMYDISGASANLAAQTGATTQQMESYKDTMLNIRGNNFGEDYNDVSEAMAVVIQMMGELNDTELQNVTESAITLRDTFGMDYQESLRAVKMMTDQFGVSSEEAFNLIVQGAQQGLNKNGDLLDSINEYSVHYSQMGLSADNFFNSLKNGTDAGTFSVDKLGDAYKEFGIRVKDTATTTDEAYELLGLNADKMRKQFAKGGDSAKEATQTVLDALFNMDDQVKQNQAGVDLFGTMWEDLGISGVRALTNVEGGISSLGNAMEDLKKKKYGDLESAVSGFGAAVQKNIVTPIADAALPVITELFQKATDTVNKISEEKSELETFIEDIRASNEETQNSIDNAKSILDGAAADASTLEAYKQTLIDLNEQENLTEFQKYQIANAVQTLGDSIPGLTDAFNEETGTLELTNKQLREMFDNAEDIAMQKAIIEAQTDLYDALAKATINKAKADNAVEVAMSDLTTKQEELYKAQESGITSTSELEAEISELNETLGDAEEVQKEAHGQYEETQKEIEKSSKALDELAEKTGISSGITKENTEANEENADSISDIGDSAAETKRELDALGRDITDLSEEEKEAVKEAAQEIVDAYDNMKEGLESSIDGSISLFDKFAEQTPITINEMIEHLESQVTAIEKWEENMTILAGRIGEGAGKGMSQELYDTLVSLGPEQTSAAVEELVRAAEQETSNFERVSELWGQKLNLKVNAKTIEDSTAAGKTLLSAAAGGMEEGIPEVETASGEVADSALQKLEENEEAFKQTAQTSVSYYAAVLASGTGEVSAAAGALGNAAYSAVKSYENAFYNVGYNMSAGVAEGIYAGQSRVINAVTNMASQALAAAENELDIHSPSRKFRKRIGQNISESTAFGIDDKASLAGASATKMSASVFKKATAWLAKYRKSHEISLEDEQYFWKQVVKHTKDGTEACVKAMNQLSAVNSNLIGNTLNSQISNNFGVSWKENEDTSAFSDGQKSVGEYYGEVYSAAKKTLNNYKILHDMSLEQEIAYWEKIQKTIMAGTDVWYDVTSTINGLKEDVKTRDEEINNAILSNAEEYINRREILGNISTAQELKYWKKKLTEVKKNSDAYYEIIDKINDLEEKQADEQAQKLQTRASVQDKILSDYKTYYKVSAKAETQYWNIARKQFKEGTQERIDADQKYFNALQTLYDQRKELDEEYKEKSKEINEELKESVEELQDAYHDAVASRKQDILSSMNLFESWDSSGYDADTLIYNLKTQVAGLALWEQKLEELKERGISTDLYDYLAEQGPDAAANIYSLAEATDEQLREYQKLFEQRNSLANSQALKDNEGLLEETNGQIAQLRKDAQKELDDLNKEYKTSIAELNETISSDLKGLVKKAGSIGEDAVAGLVAGIDKASDSVDTYKSTTKVVKKVTSALEILEEKGSEIGASTLENLLKSLSDNEKITETAQKAVQSVKYAMEKAFTEEYGELSYAGISKLNRLTEYAPQSNTVVNVDNGGLTSLLETLISAVKNLGDKMDNQQMVLDTGVLAAQMQPLISQESADVTIRRNRGRR